jgi:hypothetical protein
MVESLRTDGDTPTPAPDANQSADQLSKRSADVSSVARQVTRHTLTVDREAAWSIVLGVAFAVILGLGLFGFIEPWVSVDRGLAGAPSYSVVAIPVVSEVAVLWSVLLVVIAVVGWIWRQRWLLVVGALTTFATALVLGVLAILFHFVPHLLPFWLLPKRARPYVPDIASGSGPTLAFASSLILLIWFATAAFVRPVAHRLEDGLLHRVERRVESVWAHVTTGKTSGRRDLPPLT